MILKKVGESLIALAFGLMCAYGLLCAYAALMGDRFLFASEPTTYTFKPAYFGVSSRLGDNITMLHLKNPEARYTILYSHGNLEDIGFIRPRMEIFRKEGFSVLSYDYPGFGTSSGKKSEEGVYAAAEAAYQYLTEKQGIPPERIIVYGRSMGGGPTAYLAERFKVGGTVLHCAFVSAYRVQTGIKILPWDRFENINRVPHFKSPLLLIHGTHDETVPMWHSKLLAQKAPLSIPVHTLFVPYALHNNVVEMAREDFWKALRKFVETVDTYHESPQKEESPKQIKQEEPPATPPASTDSTNAPTL